MTDFAFPISDRRDDVIDAPTGSVRRPMELSTLGWIFGAVWSTATTGAPLTLFAQGLHASAMQFGLLAAIPYLAALLSLPSSLLIHRTGKRKRLFLCSLYFQRLMWFPLAIVPAWMIFRFGASAASGAVVVFLVLTLLMHCGQGVGGPAWASWMADLVPLRVHGKYFSQRRRWGILSAVPAALLIGWVLDRKGAWGAGNATLGWCAIIFCCAAVFGIADIAMFQFVPELPGEIAPEAELLHALREPLRDRQFLCIGTLVGVLTFAMSLMTQFQTLFLLDVLKIGDTATQMMLVVAPMVAQLLVLPAWGAAADRMGKKPMLLIAGLGLVPVTIGWCFITTRTAWVGYVLSAVGMALWAGVEVANLNLVLQRSGSRRGRAGGSGFAAVNTLQINIAGLLGGLVAGAVAQRLGGWSWRPLSGFRAFSFYDLLFAGSGILRLAAVIMLVPFIHEPTARSCRETIGFMAGRARAGGRRHAA